MDGNKPSALKVRQGLQEFMTQSREMSFGTEFSKEFFDVVNVDVELDNLGLAFNNYKIIIDRKNAIKCSFDLAKKGDLVLIIGKGRDNYMAIHDKKIKYSDYETIKKYFK